MRNVNRNEVVVIANECEDVSDLFAADRLPQWLANLWNEDLVDTKPSKHARSRNFYHVLGEWFKGLMLVIGMLSIAVTINTHRYIMCAVVAMTVVIIAPIGTSWIKNLGQKEFGLWKAIKWLFDLVPMKSADFPQCKEDLAMLYCDLMADVAKLTLEFEGKNQRRNAAIAKSHLEILFEGRCGFGFVRDQKKGLGPTFELARQAEGYRILDVSRWMNRFAK